jgi:hypothetical protein
MPRNACLLYKNKRPKNTGSPRYLGILRLADGQTFWVGAWRRTVGNEAAIELKLSPKADPKS